MHHPSGLLGKILGGVVAIVDPRGEVRKGCSPTRFLGARVTRELSAALAARWLTVSRPVAWPGNTPSSWQVLRLAVLRGRAADPA